MYDSLRARPEVIRARAFFYHSGEDKAVVGVAEVIRESYPDPTAAGGDSWVVVDVKAETPFKTR